VSDLWRRCLIYVFVCGLVGSLALFGISYIFEISLHQTWMSASTELLKHPRFLKSIAIAHCVFVPLCLVSACLLPKKLLTVNEVLLGFLLYVAYFIASGLTWFFLTMLHVIDPRDPFYFYIGSLEPIEFIVPCFVIGLFEIWLIVWLRKRVLKQVP